MSCHRHNTTGVADTLEELWLSYNKIEKLANIEKLTKLRVLYMSNNAIANFNELEKLGELPELSELLLTNNPIFTESLKDDKPPQEIGSPYR